MCTRVSFYDLHVCDNKRPGKGDGLLRPKERTVISTLGTTGRFSNERQLGRTHIGRIFPYLCRVTSTTLDEIGYSMFSRKPVFVHSHKKV